MTLKQQTLYLPKTNVAFPSPSGNSACNKIKWNSNEKVFSCVQRRNIECGLPAPHAFNPGFYSRRKQYSKAHIEEDLYCSGNTIMLVRGSKNNKSASLVGKEDFIPGIYGNSTFSRQVH
ncbi:Hypothetical predicted protein [Podarcis lilfordi]|uniref:Uncharacterized protein n=1 Tax=Podarcis lilfordi TaxID=74358 RepID=A0AA35VWM5_9SAUR|nr:Hypothetical predicted protein [Podarcis lilfordi]